MKMTKLEKILISIILIIITLFVKQISTKQYTGPEFIPQPIQQNLQEKEYVYIETEHGKIKVELVASYNIQAGVIGRYDYNSDYAAIISPMDLALAWADLNQKKNLELVDYEQFGRWYYYNVKPNNQITVDYVGRNSSNTHIIPANKKILTKLQSVKTNSFVTISGYLVNVIFEHDTWTSSLSRLDTGDGACEILLVEKITVN